jgi:hypothetical protein
MLHQRVDDAAATLAAGQVQWRVAFLLTNHIVVLLKKNETARAVMLGSVQSAHAMRPQWSLARELLAFGIV